MAYNMPYNPYPSYTNYGFTGQPYTPNQPPMGMPQNTFNPPQQIQNTYTQPQQIQNAQAMNNQQTTQPIQSNQNIQPMVNNQIQMNPMQGISSSSKVVASKEEALAVSADFLGAPIIMPMLINGEVSAIYVKQWDINRGQANFAEFYRQQENNQQNQQYYQQEPQPQFATMDNINDIQNYINGLNQNIEQLKDEIDRLKSKPAPATTSKNNSKKVNDTTTD